MAADEEEEDLGTGGGAGLERGGEEGGGLAADEGGAGLGVEGGEVRAGDFEPDLCPVGTSRFSCLGISGVAKSGAGTSPDFFVLRLGGVGVDGEVGPEEW